MEDKITNPKDIDPVQVKQAWKDLITKQNQSPFANGDYVVKPTEQKQQAHGQLLSVTGGENWDVHSIIPAAAQTGGHPPKLTQGKQ